MLDIQKIVNASEAFVTEISGYRAVWKLLSIKEYEALRGLVRSGFILEGQARAEAFRLAVFNHGPVFDLWPAGLTDAIGAMILWYSGDCNSSTLKQDLVSLRETYSGNSPHEHMINVILTAFPNLTFQDVESWSRNKLLQTFIRSEHLLAFRLGDSFNYLNISDIKFADEVDDSSEMVDLTTEFKLQEEEGIAANPWGDTEEYSSAAEWHKKLTREQLAQLDQRR